MAEGVEGDFHKVHPDLLPGDITGTDVFRPQLGTFEFQAGPIFHNLILADEINRAPAKVQSALLEAMAERQVMWVGQPSAPSVVPSHGHANHRARRHLPASRGTARSPSDARQGGLS